MKNLRLKTGIAIVLCTASLAFQTGMAQAAQKVRVNIPAQDLSAALIRFGRETRTEIVFSLDAVRGKKAAAVKGEYERDQALEVLLATSGMTYRITTQGAIIIEPLQASAQYAAADPAPLAREPAGAGAQEQAPVASAIEEVLVTARRREESLQDVPIAISAIGGAELSQRSIDRIENLNSVAPNLMVMGGGGQGESQASFRVRGLPGVSVYIDGVDQPTTDGLLTMSVVEVDRIEVLRGPQGTLFGNSSLGGAVSYVTRPPADTFGARFRGSVGSFSRQDFQASIDLPIADTFKTKFTVSNQSRDGFVHSALINRSYGDINDELYRADFLWEPLDSVSARYNVEVSDTKRNGPARVVEEVGGLGTITVGGQEYSTNPRAQAYANVGIVLSPQTHVAGYPGGALGPYDVRLAWDGPGFIIDQIRHGLDINWEINDTFRVRSISGYKELTRHTAPDYDGASDVQINDRETGLRHFSFGQELQLLGSHERVDWVLGAFYQQQYNRNRTNLRTMAEFTCDLWSAPDRAVRRVTIADQAACFNLRAKALNVTNLVATPNMTQTQLDGLKADLVALNPVYNGVRMSNFTAEAASNSNTMSIARQDTQAFFGDLTWRITDQLTLAAGLRYSKDENDGNLSIGGGNNRLALMSHAGQNLNGQTGVLPNFFGYYKDLLPAPTNPTEFDALTKRLTLQYRWTPDIMTYIGFADGYQPGSANVLNIPGLFVINSATGRATDGYMRDVYNDGNNDIPLVILNNEQTVKNYEIGLRADWLGGALRTNLTAFFTDWRNIPVSQYISTMWWDTDGNGYADSLLDVTGDGIPDVNFFSNTRTTSVAKAEVKGIELETTWRATDALRFNLNLGYLKTEYVDLGQAGALGVTPAVNIGTPFNAAPEITASVGGQYEFVLGNGAALMPRLDYTYTDDYTLISTAVQQRIQKGFGLLNARVTYDPGDNWTLSLIGSNLTDERYKNSGFYSVGDQIDFVTIGRPREWGLTFDFSFE